MADSRMKSAANFGTSGLAQWKFVPLHRVRTSTENKRVWAESFTGGQKFHSNPGNLKKRGDRAFSEGINSTLLCLYIQQYDDDSYSGVDAWDGVEFNRKNTWFSHADLFIQYLRSCNFFYNKDNLLPMSLILSAKTFQRFPALALRRFHKATNRSGE